MCFRRRVIIVPSIFVLAKQSFEVCGRFDCNLKCFDNSELSVVVGKRVTGILRMIHSSLLASHLVRWSSVR